MLQVGLNSAPRAYVLASTRAHPRTLERRIVPLFVTLLLELFLLGHMATVQAWARDDGSCRLPAAEGCSENFALQSGRKIRLYASKPLSLDAGLERAVVVIHGNRRDPDRYFEALAAAAIREDRLADTLLLAPGFETLKDHPEPSRPYWSSRGWKIGHRSRDASRISSFTVVDELLGEICPTDPERFPNLKSVVLIGHSAGGQFVNRYAAGGKGCPNPAIEVRYVVMNPSSYLYIDGRRRDDTADAFRKPRFWCFDYDDYKYGTQDLNTYMKKVGIPGIRSNLARRNVFYLAGIEDDDPRSSSLDKSCEADRQGAHRLDRFRNYRDYTKLFDDWTGSTFATIPGVGHNGAKMMMSETTRRIVFR